MEEVGKEEGKESVGNGRVRKVGKIEIERCDIVEIEGLIFKVWCEIVGSVKYEIEKV